MIRSRVAPALAVSLLAVLPTAGCYQGFDGTVTSQGPTGNGTDFTVPPDGGAIMVQDATLVADPEDPSTANLIMTVINGGTEADALLSATIGSTQGATEGPVTVQPGQSVRIGGPGGEPGIAVTGLSTPLGGYETITVTFRDAGSADATAILVPATGYYEDYAPTVDAEG